MMRLYYDNLVKIIKSSMEFIMFINFLNLIPQSKQPNEFALKFNKFQIHKLIPPARPPAGSFFLLS